ncbi:MAG: VOC family protein [Pyrinomonadaceae bacterium]
MKAHFILFVADQSASTEFYAKALGIAPSLNVHGMTEFEIGDAVLGLMPRAGAEKLLGPAGAISAEAANRSETYLVVENALVNHRRAIAAGAVEISAMSERDWGHTAAYSLDPDGHILAFAEPTNG